MHPIMESPAKPLVGTPPLFLPMRWCIATLLFCVLFVGFAFRVLLSITIGSIGEEYGYTNPQKGLALGAFFLGYVLLQVPGALLAGRYGGWSVLLASSALSTLGILVTPICARESFGALVFARFLTGLGQGPFIPVTHALILHWAPRAESSTFVGFIWSATSLGIGLALPASGAIIAAAYGPSTTSHPHIVVGWEGVFYVWGFVGVGVTALWAVLGASSPALHMLTSSEERKYIESTREPVGRADATVPWARLLVHRAIVAMTVAHLCHNWICYLLLAWL